MGVLDDAIRQHLELKRAHGASEEEVKRQEVEALGPVRRDIAPAESQDEVDQPLDEAGAEPEDAPALEPDDEMAGEPTSDAPGAFVQDEELAEAPHGLVQSEPGYLEEQEEGYEEPASPALGGPPAEEGTADQAPALEPEPSDQAPGDEDVLDETPEFLQETPEHDRLWFEQKPPRDFDFE